MLPVMHSTTILCVRRDGKVAIGGDGQVTVGETVMKANANKVRTLRGGKILAGFAGAAADAFTLFEKFEEKLERYPSNLPRAAVELAKDWRSDRVLRRLEALLVVADKEHGFVVSGSGELIEPDDGVLAISSARWTISGGLSLVELSSARAAARANDPPDPIARTPSSGSISSPEPLTTKPCSLSATTSRASSRRSTRSERQALASSTAAPGRFDGYRSSFSSNFS